MTLPPQPLDRRVDRRRVLLAGAATALIASATRSRAAVPPPEGVRGRSVLVTGSSSGFGRLLAEHLARGGARVFATMRNLDGGRRPEAQELARIARADGLDITLLQLDVTDAAEVRAAVRAAETASGGALDAVINNAGIAFGVPAELADLEATRRIFETNLFGALAVANAALPAMRRRKAAGCATSPPSLGGSCCQASHSIAQPSSAWRPCLRPWPTSWRRSVST